MQVAFAWYQICWVGSPTPIRT